MNAPEPPVPDGLFETKRMPLLSRRAFALRMLRVSSVCLAIVAVTLGAGALGYRETEHLAWIDAFLNAAMILTGMGQVDIPTTTAGKLFAIFYALFSGLVFLSLIAVFLAPVAHRLLHAFHLEEQA